MATAFFYTYRTHTLGPTFIISTLEFKLNNETSFNFVGNVLPCSNSRNQNLITNPLKYYSDFRHYILYFKVFSITISIIKQASRRLIFCIQIDFSQLEEIWRERKLELCWVHLSNTNFNVFSITISRIDQARRLISSMKLAFN